jgi:hypothetical protein
MSTNQVISLIGVLGTLMGIQTLLLIYYINAKFDTVTARFDAIEKRLDAIESALPRRLTP